MSTTEFQEISLSPELPKTINTTTPESLLLNLEDAAEIKNPSPEYHRRFECSVCFADGENQAVQISNADSDGGDGDRDRDGFQTPTSADHKIPVAKPCPPAPKKPEISNRWSTSRRSSKASGVGRGVRFYISDDVVEAIFSSISGSDLEQKSKRPRRDDHGGE